MRRLHIPIRRVNKDVSTLIRPEGRMRQFPPPQSALFGVVSTLIRPEGRMRLLAGHQKLAERLFQPSSDPKAGCDAIRLRLV